MKREFKITAASKNLTGKEFAKKKERETKESGQLTGEGGET